MDIRVQQGAFDIGAETAAFAARNTTSGAVCTFIGQMRDFRGADKTSGEPIASMELDAYPGMADKQLADLAAEAQARWPLDDIAIVHRFGVLKPGEPIVFVATASAHRGDAFAACEFLMDWLKTKAPFWKKETGPSGSVWVEAQASDDARAARWKET
ncbi:MAG: molybdenum cofactor biosynthesis protein MoaE [Rhodospirillaceae bacterium]|nr:molybdenum cofactor biosynthesis protein MoaE [Rhodospirillaceae bacterium]